jgi:hypothetical protein
VDPLGMPVLIWALYPLDDGQRRPDPDRVGDICRVHRWPVPPFSSVIDVDRLPNPATPGPLAEGSFASAHDRDDRRGRGRLHKFSRVNLVYQEDLPGRERFYGRALDQDGAPVLIYVDYPLVQGARMIDPDDGGSEVHFAYRWPIEPFGSIIDLAEYSPNRPRRRATAADPGLRASPATKLSPPDQTKDGRMNEDEPREKPGKAQSKPGKARRKEADKGASRAERRLARRTAKIEAKRQAKYAKLERKEKRREAKQMLRAQKEEKRERREAREFRPDAGKGPADTGAGSADAGTAQG